MIKAIDREFLCSFHNQMIMSFLLKSSLVNFEAIHIPKDCVRWHYPLKNLKIILLLQILLLSAKFSLLFAWNLGADVSVISLCIFKMRTIQILPKDRTKKKQGNHTHTHHTHTRIKVWCRNREFFRIHVSRRFMIGSEILKAN